MALPQGRVARKDHQQRQRGNLVQGLGNGGVVVTGPFIPPGGRLEIPTAGSNPPGASPAPGIPPASHRRRGRVCRHPWWNAAAITRGTTISEGRKYRVVPDIWPPRSRSLPMIARGGTHDMHKSNTIPGSAWDRSSATDIPSSPQDDQRWHQHSEGVIQGQVEVHQGGAVVQPPQLR